MRALQEGPGSPYQATYAPIELVCGSEQVNVADKSKAHSLDNEMRAMVPEGYLFHNTSILVVSYQYYLHFYIPNHDVVKFFCSLLVHYHDTLEL